MAGATRAEVPIWGRASSAGERLAARFGWPLVAPGLLAALVLVCVSFADGGLLPYAWRLATFAFAALTAAAIVGRDRCGVALRDSAWIAALALLMAWIAASATWSGHTAASLVQAERVLLYAAAAMAIVVIAERASVRHLLAGVLAAITGVCAYGLAVYLLTSPPLDPYQGALLYQPLGYANALGIFAAIGIVLGVGLAWGDRRRIRHIAALATVPVLGTTLWYTSSRGGAVALAAGVAVVVAANVGRRALVALAAASAVLAAVATIAVAAGPWTLGTLVGVNRASYWRVAWKEFELNPGLGSGAGTFGDYWWRYRQDPSFAHDAHNLYLEALAELGPGGLVLVLAAVGAPLIGLVRVRDGAGAAAAGAYVAFAVHAAVDWDWEVPAVTLAGLFCGGALLVSARRAPPRPLPSRVRNGLLAVTLVVAAVATARLFVGPRSPYG